jgi:hypothetical protein
VGRRLGGEFLDDEYNYKHIDVNHHDYYNKHKYKYEYEHYKYLNYNHDRYGRYSLGRGERRG